MHTRRSPRDYWFFRARLMRRKDNLSAIFFLVKLQPPPPLPLSFSPVILLHAAPNAQVLPALINKRSALLRLPLYTLCFPARLSIPLFISTLLCTLAPRYQKPHSCLESDIAARAVAYLNCPLPFMPYYRRKWVQLNRAKGTLIIRELTDPDRQVAECASISASFLPFESGLNLQ